MPAILTHHLFGEDASSLLPTSMLIGQEDLLAFLLGSQGPDPLWARFSATPGTVRACNRLATLIHEGRMVDVFMSMRDAVTRLSDQDKTVGRAFALGVASHYLLDSTTHPLIYALQDELIAAEPSLQGMEDEVHTLLEADIDAWVLWQTRRKTVLDVPSASALTHTTRIDRIAGALVSQTAWEIFGIEVGAAEYGRAVNDYQLIYRTIDPPAERKKQVLQRIEKRLCGRSRIEALAHRVWTSDECPSANLQHRLWRNPSTGEASRASFADLFHDALGAWPAFSQRFVEGDREVLSAMVDGINYNGIPTKE